MTGAAIIRPRARPTAARITEVAAEHRSPIGAVLDPEEIATKLVNGTDQVAAIQVVAADIPVFDAAVGTLARCGISR